jgi:TrbC/VIRB2 family pilin
MGAVRFNVGRVVAPLTLVFMGLVAAEPACAGLTKATTIANTLNSWLLGIGTVIASIALCVAAFGIMIQKKPVTEAFSAPIIGMIAFGSIADLIGLLM